MSLDQTHETANKKNPISVDDQQIIDLAAELQTWTSAKAHELLPFAKWSLEAVTHVTEYEDEKANRILTAIAFLSALVAVAFAAIVQRFPFSVSETLSSSGHRLAGYMVIALYSLFGLYFLLLTVGALMTLWAVQPRFRIPKVWGHTKRMPASFLFFEKILEVSGKNWANAFTGTSSEQLELEYLKNSILETYLIAQKIPKKLRPLTVGVRLFIASTIVLILLLPMCAITVACVDVAPPKITSRAETNTETLSQSNESENKTSQSMTTSIRSNGSANKPGTTTGVKGHR